MDIYEQKPRMGFVCEVISSCLLLNILENDGKLGLKWLNHQKKGIKWGIINI